MQQQQMSSGVGVAMSYQEPAVVYNSNNMLVPVGSTTYDRYKSSQSRGLGTTLIIIGILCIILNGVCIGMSDYSYDDLSFIGHGIWSGVMFIITGSLGVGAGANKTKCLIVSFMVMCIITSLATISLLAVASLGAAILADDCSNKNYGYNYGYPYYNKPCGTTSGYIVIVAMEASMAVLGFIAGVITIWGSALCCSGVCGCCSQSTSIIAPQPSGNFPNNGQTIYFSQSQAGQTPFQQQFPYSQGMMVPPQVANYAQPQWTMPPPNGTNNRFTGMHANATVQVPDDFMGHQQHLQNLPMN